MTAYPTDQDGLLKDRHTHLPPGTGTFGMWLFLIALGILFASSMVGYLVIRLTTLKPGIDPVSGEVVRQAGPALGSIAMPAGLWVSTLVILASSFSIHLAMRAIQHERQAVFRRCLAVTAALAVLFLVVQTPSLWALLEEHRAYRGLAAQDRTVGLLPYGMVFFLIVVHAAHLLGGMIPLGIVTQRAWAHKYDHESYNPVRYLAMYWHFLDAVWVCLFAGLLLIG
jgi:heme/copper-type cytochrome/quinol oxidase subunit 3